MPRSSRGKNMNVPTIMKATLMLPLLANCNTHGSGQTVAHQCKRLLISTQRIILPEAVDLFREEKIDERLTSFGSQCRPCSRSRLNQLKIQAYYRYIKSASTTENKAARILAVKACSAEKSEWQPAASQTRRIIDVFKFSASKLRHEHLLTLHRSACRQRKSRCVQGMKGSPDC